MSTEQDHLDASLEFLRTCISATPLAGEAAMFERDRVDSKLAAGILEGLEAFESDLARFGLELGSAKEMFADLRFAANIQAAYFYRVERALFLNDVSQPLPVLATVAKLLTGVEIYYSANIGPGLKIIHGVGTVIGAACTVGSHFTVYQGVTIGDKLGRDTGVRPVLADHVIASTGAQILGPVEVGDHTVIGANAAVIRSLPSRCVAGGVPARVLKADLSDEDWDEFWTSFRG